MLSRQPIAASASNEWYYRTRFERSGNDTWLLEYGLYPSAWTSPWFQSVLNANIVAFLRWCRNREISFGKIAGWLNKHAPSPPRGAAWHKSTVRYLVGRSSSRTEETNQIKPVMRRLKGLRWAERSQQPGLDQVIAVSDSIEERARRVWETHALMLPPFRMLTHYLRNRLRGHERIADPYPKGATGMQRRAEFGLRFLGTPSLKPKSLRAVIDEAKRSSHRVPGWAVELEQLELAVPGFLDFQLTKFDMQLLGQHKTSEALLRNLCKLEGISTRSARRYKSANVQ